MKTALILFLLLFSKTLFGQAGNDRTIFLDSTYIVTNFEEHVYYRIVKDYNQDKSEYYVTQYFKSGEKESEGISTLKDVLKQKGLYTSYYRNGNKKSELNYDETGYKIGYCKGFYENGKNKFEGSFVKSTYQQDGLDMTESTLKVDNYWNEYEVQTVQNGIGDYSDDGIFDALENKSISSGKLINGIKVGVWSGRNEKLGITFSEYYTNGKLIEGRSIDKNSNEYSYNEIATFARPAGGMKVFYSFISKNYKVPENLKSKVKVITKFDVTTENKITNLKNISSGGKEVDEEAMRTISKFNSFVCAKFRGVKVKSIYTLPITLQGSK